MNIGLIENTTNVIIPIIFLFWAFIFVYIIHILEETLVPEVFVEKVKRLYVSNYGWKQFFGFNTLLLCINICAVVLYENIGNAWIIFPLAMGVERVFNGLYHFFETVISKKYSSGLLSSVMTWILEYLLIRYSFVNGNVKIAYIIISSIIGIIIGSLMIFPLITGKLKNLKW